MSYKDNKKWRVAHPDRRHAQKPGYYARTGSHTGPALGSPWTDDLDELVIAHSVPDRRLALLLGRSVNAVQKRRSRLNAAVPPEPAGGQE